MSDGTMLAVGSRAPGGTTIFNATDGRPLWRTCSSGAGMYTTDGNHILLGDGADKIYTADGKLVTELIPGFDTASGYWKTAYISQDKSKVVLAANIAPVAYSTYSPEDPMVNETITFDASNSTDVDGTITTHSYSSTGNYEVDLTVTDDDGLEDTTNQTIAVSSDSCLADALDLDFSETQFYFVDPLESWFVFKFKVTNKGTKNLLLGSCCSCNIGNEVVGLPLLAPQGETPLAPGESMWIKILPVGGDDCGYDSHVLQTVTRTMRVKFHDNNDSYHSWEANHLTVEETVQIEVVNRETLEGDVIIQGIVVDEEGNPVPYVQIDIGGYGAKVPIACDDGGHFSYSIAQVPVYFLI
ncbi:MAG: PKD domain-containing protein, partial [Thermotogae bacterium]|nr:PKD domain-containing protein [Thermotogota bacterium]